MAIGVQYKIKNLDMQIARTVLGHTKCKCLVENALGCRAGRYNLKLILQYIDHFTSIMVIGG